MTSLNRIRTYGYLACVALLTLACNKRGGIVHRNDWIISGEPTAESIILHARLEPLTEPGGVLFKESKAVGYFEFSEDSQFVDSRKSELLTAHYANDFILKSRITGLKPGAAYYYRVFYGSDDRHLAEGLSGTFQTLPGAESTKTVSFISVTGMNYGRFVEEVPYRRHAGQLNDFYEIASEEDQRLGYPAFETILRAHKPTFWVGNGDNVYYDSPDPKKRYISQDELRERWHQLFSFPRSRQFFSEVTTYWTKDDHDYRFNDSDSTNEKFSEPSHELGVYTFREQVPVTDLSKPEEKTYRTYRLNKHLQIWFTEGRDYRSPLSWPDGPEKTLWGKDQLEWLKTTLLASDATYKVLLSPTPLVGPDDHRPSGDSVTLDKKDNHADPGGYKYEGDRFFEWLQSNGFTASNFFIVCGDRHWQYHSIHPSGIHEFSSGAFIKQNARVGRKPGEVNSTDPQGLVQQPYLQERPTGAFVKVNVTEQEGKAQVLVEFIEETGDLLYSYILPTSVIY